MQTWALFLILILVCLIFQGFFAMMEMALVSFNRIRLEYFVKQGNKKAICLAKLLRHPTYLFGTTLIGVNFFLQLGSEASRLFYAHLGLDPDWAPISQIIIVVIFAELAPMFAARAHAEHVAMLGIMPIYFLSKFLSPFIWILNGICRFIDWILNSPSSIDHYLTREEIQKVIEAKDEKHPHLAQEQLDTLVQNIFEIKAKSPKELMIPLNKVQMIPYSGAAKQVKDILSQSFISYLPLFFQKRENIFGIIYSRDLLRLTDDAPVQEISRSPWFITEKNSIFEILKQFRSNNQQVAIVLDEEGSATGILTLDSLIEEIFHNTTRIDREKGFSPQIIVDRTFFADEHVQKVNALLGLDFPFVEGDTLEDLMTKTLGHSPQKSEAVCIGKFELTLKEVPFLADKKIQIASI